MNAVRNPLFLVTYTVANFGRLTHYVHAPDIAEAGMMAEEYLGDTYNLGRANGDAFSIDLIQEVGFRTKEELDREANEIFELQRDNAHKGTIHLTCTAPKQKLGRNKILGMVVISMLLVVYVSILMNKAGVL